MSLIYTFFDKTSYYYSNEENSNNDLYVPLNVDTEFYTRDLNDPKLGKNPSCTITVQVRGLKDNGKIYTHRDCADIARHDLMRESFIGYQYLIDSGYSISYRKDVVNNIKKLSSLPKVYFHLYLHFACADIIRIFYDDYQNDIRGLILNANNSGSGITQRRRLETYHRGKIKGFQSSNGYNPFCLTNWLMEYEGVTYQVGIRVFDTIAIAGQQSYSDLAELVGYELPYKNLLTKEDKENMIDTYLTHNDFDNYALGDLYAYELLLGFDHQYKHLLQGFLGIKDNDKSTCRLTIGSSMAMVLSKLLKSKMNNPKLFKEINKYGNSDYLRKLKDTRAILSKVDGGRCYNNRPLETSVFKSGNYNNIDDLTNNLNMLCDIDISGAYGKGLSLQDYPIGVPKMFCHQLDKNNKYMTLREFLDKHGKELLDGLWIMRVSTLKPLKYPQDLISSWVIDPNKINRLSDPSDDDLSVDYPKEGFNKIFTNEIYLGLISSDILQWIDNICSQSQRKELYDNLMVVNAMWYEKDKELKDIKEVEKYYENYSDQDESFYDGDSLYSVQKNSYYWYRINIGDLLINELLKVRNNYDKKTHKKENTFYKLCINTTYGILVSKFFDVSNSVVGNNITARCRCMMYYLEKGLNGYQSITDGCIFELDNVVYPVKGKRLTANNLVKGYQRVPNEKLWFTDKLKVVKRKIYMVTKWYNLHIKENTHIDYYKYVDNPSNQSEVDKLKKEFEEYLINKKDDENTGASDKVVKIFDDLVKKNESDFEDEIIKSSDIFYDIEKDVLAHLRNIFPNVDVLHKNIINDEGVEQKGYYTLEIKCFCNKAIFHGNANYYLDGVKELKDKELVKKEKVVKMRGYGKDSFIFESNEDLDSLEDNEDNLYSYLFEDIEDLGTELEDIDILGLNIPENFFNSLKNDLTRVQRQDYFIQNKIIKCKDYKSNYNTYKHIKLEVGYTDIDVRLLTELVLSQFTYPTLSSYKKWIENHYKHKSKYGQGYESCFLNDDGTLNYQLMINTIDEKIKEDKGIKLKQVDHPSHKLRLLRKEDIQNRFLN
ncbi:hypothetical protein GM3708_3641 (plasmid) [Geminocystis sp. NIES-3708]|uniref:hypothetical protein n=1 Tax=Geminocystis sp. NIES-3708 TaxID=1615909 RepID=UPI0005FC8365|nr:hypothetical protein [Geminocystis sp. NIES-3708]BAQ63235.1 hypothetical protein GM3708_3641 [Geminocystis sp. NIES-3708]